MSIGDRIRQRRIELDLTQEELAKRLGYASRSSVNKMETARDLPLKKVEAMAKALDVTPAYLMGWENETKINGYIMEYAKMSIAVELLDSLNDEGIERAIDYMEMLSKIYKKEE